MNVMILIDYLKNVIALMNKNIKYYRKICLKILEFLFDFRNETDLTTEGK